MVIISTVDVSKICATTQATERLRKYLVVKTVVGIFLGGSVVAVTLALATSGFVGKIATGQISECCRPGTG